MAGFAAELREGLLAERDEILEFLLVGLAAGGLRHVQLFEVGRLDASVAQRERTRLAHEDERRSAAVLVSPERAFTGAFEADVTTKVGTVAHVENECGLGLVEAHVEAGRAEPQREGLPVAVPDELERISPLHVQHGARAGRRAEIEAGDAVGERGPRNQGSLAGFGLRGQRAIDHGPRRVVAEGAGRRRGVLRGCDMETCERGNGQNRH